MMKRSIAALLFNFVFLSTAWAQITEPDYYFEDRKCTNKIRFTERTRKVYIAGNNTQIYYSGGVFIINEDRGVVEYGRHDIRWHFLDSTGAYLARNVRLGDGITTFIPYFEDGVAISKPEPTGFFRGPAYIINTKGEKLVSLSDLGYGSVSDSIRNGAFLAIKNDKELCYVGVDGKVKWPHLTQEYEHLRDIGIEMGIRPLCCGRRRHMDLYTRLYGYIDADGKMVIHPQFLEARDFSEGLAAVKVNTEDGPKWGFIDDTGKFAIEPMFQHVPGDFHGGVSILVKNTGWKTIMLSTGEIKNWDLDMIDEVVGGSTMIKFWDKRYYICDAEAGKWISVWFNRRYDNYRFDSVIGGTRPIYDINPPLRYEVDEIYTGNYKPTLKSPYGGFFYLGGGFFWYSRMHDSDDVDVESGVIRPDGERVFVFRISEF